MYQLYIKKSSLSKNLIGEYRELEDAQTKIKTELEKNPDIKYIIEETTGRIDSYGELIAYVVEEN